MSEGQPSIQDRLTQVKEILTGNKRATTAPWDPESTSFPTLAELQPNFNAPLGAPTAWNWGENDEIGRLNLLTPTRVKAAAAEIRTGERVVLNLPLDVPINPGFHREKFQHTIKPIYDGAVHDDLYTLNTQSGTQFDGFRHFSWTKTKTYYNNTQAEDIFGAKANLKCSIHHWSTAGGIAGRGLLLDYRAYALKHNIDYDPHVPFSFKHSDLVACGKEQGLDIRPAAQGGDVQVGDMLFIRGGFVERYYEKSEAERLMMGTADTYETGSTHDGGAWAGVEQSEEMKTWLHDCYFSTVAGDQPAFECYPPKTDWYLHEYLLTCWGVPIGEMLDLEKLAQKCRQHNRWTFFVTSSPANCVGGISTHANAIAIL